MGGWTKIEGVKRIYYTLCLKCDHIVLGWPEKRAITKEDGVYARRGWGREWYFVCPKCGAGRKDLKRTTTKFDGEMFKDIFIRGVPL